MAGQLNRKALEQIVKDDLEWLSSQPQSLERYHIEQVLPHWLELVLAVPKNYTADEIRTHFILHPLPYRPDNA